MSQVMLTTRPPRDSGTAGPSFIEHFARFGFAIKGVVYCIIGALAALAPVGLGTRPTGTQGALRTLLEQSIGSLLLSIVAFGFVCFGLFQLVRAVDDPDHVGSGFQGVWRRIGWAANALVQFALASVAIGMLVGLRRAAAIAGDDERQVHDWTAWALAYPPGRWVVAGVGIGILIYGVLQVRRGLIGKLDRRLSFVSASDRRRRWARGVSRFGVAARGIVFGLIGVFLIRAAYDANAHEARGMGGTLRALATEPYGPWLLGTAAMGLIAYGLYDFVLARYRRIT